MKIVIEYGAAYHVSINRNIYTLNKAECKI